MVAPALGDLRTEEALPTNSPDAANAYELVLDHGNAYCTDGAYWLPRVSDDAHDAGAWLPYDARDAVELYACPCTSAASPSASAT
jgi:hypothetical protein